MRDLIQQLPALDPRMETGIKSAPEKLLARLKAPRAVRAGDIFRLDGSQSLAPPGRTIVEYRWRFLQ